ncbi:MAG: CPBP family intramembrane glutamic endopeptidase [Pseudomonadota bacterium]
MDAAARLAGAPLRALFWAVGFSWLAAVAVDALSLVHYQLHPFGAERFWRAWWDPAHPLNLVAWGGLMLVGYAALRADLHRLDIVALAAPAGALSRPIVVIAVLAVAADWVASGLIEQAALAVTGQDDLPAYRPGYAFEVTRENAFGDLFSGVVAAPLFEELAFRGLLLGCLLARGWNPVAAVVAVAVIFGLTHTQYYFSGMLMVIASGLIFGALRILTGGLAAPTLAHALSNLSISLQEMLFPA